MAIPLPSRRTWPTLFLIMILVGTSPAAPGDQPGLTYRTGTSEVRLTFSATDQNDHGVATLQANDFAVVDTGFIVRDFQSFTRSDYSKLEIAILIDSSESMSAHVRKELPIRSNCWHRPRACRRKTSRSFRSAIASP